LPKAGVVAQNLSTSDIAIYQQLPQMIRNNHASLTARGTQFMQNTAQFSDGILVNRVGTVYERVEIVASPPIRIHGWVTLDALHKIVPLLWVCETGLQKSLDQVSNIRSCTIAAHMTYPNT
jgi:hypothetical protein